MIVLTVSLLIFLLQFFFQMTVCRLIEKNPPESLKISGVEKRHVPSAVFSSYFLVLSSNFSLQSSLLFLYFIFQVSLIIPLSGVDMHHVYIVRPFLVLFI